MDMQCGCINDNDTSLEVWERPNDKTLDMTFASHVGDSHIGLLVPVPGQPAMSDAEILRIAKGQVGDLLPDKLFELEPEPTKTLH
jgi:hypothetical protein